ncbi:MAG: sulfite exporter TauE/SafE family protein [Stagnimonas sp.]|nr:sulfite exporter TauE/SafE family protein [Stagnimonas sp.]
MDGLGFSLAGLLVGTAVGATGVGGGSLMTPILILFYGISPAVAVGTDLLYASISKAWGVVLHQRRGTLDWQIVGRLAIGSVPASFLALAFLHTIGASAELDRLIKLTLAVAVIVTASFTLLQDLLLRYLRAPAGLSVALARHQTLGTILSGVLIGAVVTVSSVGAGVIGMMLLMLLYPRHETIRLVGADLAHAVIITGIAGLGHARLGTVDLHMLGFLLLGAMPGIWVGSRIGFRLDARQLKRVISVLLVLVGGMTLYKAMAA